MLVQLNLNINMTKLLFPVIKANKINVRYICIYTYICAFVCISIFIFVYISYFFDMHTRLPWSYTCIYNFTRIIFTFCYSPFIYSDSPRLTLFLANFMTSERGIIERESLSSLRISTTLPHFFNLKLWLATRDCVIAV